MATFTSVTADRGNRILKYDLNQPELRVHDTVFLDSLRHMLRLPPSPLLRDFPNAQCVCGFILSSDPLISTIAFIPVNGLDINK